MKPAQRAGIERRNKYRKLMTIAASIQGPAQLSLLLQSIPDLKERKAILSLIERFLKFPLPEDVYTIE